MHGDLYGLLARIEPHRMRELLVDFANIASPPTSTTIAAEWYAGLLRASGAAEVRIVRDRAAAPCVVAGFPGLRQRPMLEFVGHLDTPPLPFLKAHGEGGRIIGRGVASGKAGLIAAAEAARVLAGAGPLPGGGLLFVAHSRHFGNDVAADSFSTLLQRGIVGDAAIITSGDHAIAPIAGLGKGTFRVVFTAASSPTPYHSHLLPRPAANASSKMLRNDATRTHGGVQASILDTARTFVNLLKRRSLQLARSTDALLGGESIFVSHVEGGERFGQATATCVVEGTWHWLPERQPGEVYSELQEMSAQAAAATGASVEVTLSGVRNGFRLLHDEPIVECLRSAYRAVEGRELPLGGSSFACDSAAFLEHWGLAAVCHGVGASPDDAGSESITLEELVRAAQTYLCLGIAYLTRHPSAAMSDSAEGTKHRGIANRTHDNADPTRASALVGQSVQGLVAREMHSRRP